MTTGEYFKQVMEVKCASERGIIVAGVGVVVDEYRGGVEEGRGVENRIHMELCHVMERENEDATLLLHRLLLWIFFWC